LRQGEYKVRERTSKSNPMALRRANESSEMRPSFCTAILRRPFVDGILYLDKVVWTKKSLPYPAASALKHEPIPPRALFHPFGHPGDRCWAQPCRPDDLRVGRSGRQQPRRLPALSQFGHLRFSQEIPKKPFRLAQVPQREDGAIQRLDVNSGNSSHGALVG